MSYHTLHFDFNYSENVPNNQMFLKIRGQKIPLKPHCPESLELASKTNKAASTLLKQKPNALTHYVDAPVEHFHANSLTRIMIVGDVDETDPQNHLAPLYHISYMPNLEDHTTYFKKLVNKMGMVTPAALVAHGITSVSDDDPWQHLVDQYHLKSAHDVALYLAGQHPNTMSNKPQTHLAMLHEHIYPTCKKDPDSIEQVNNITFLTINAIIAQGPPGTDAGFAIIKQAINPTTREKQLYGFDLGDKGKTPIRKAGDAVLQYELTKTTIEWLAPAACKPVITSRNDTQFQKQTWNVNQGQSVINNENSNTATPNRNNLSAAETGASSNWLVSPNTSTHGITVDQSTIKMEVGTNNFSVDVYNNFLRISGAYVQFFNNSDLTHQINLTSSGWKDKGIGAFQTDFKKFVDIIPNVDTIIGIPLPTAPTNLQFVFPVEAQSAKLLFGSMGSYNFDAHIIWPGFLETGIFQFGIPIFFMAAGAAITDSEWYKEFIQDTVELIATQAAKPLGGTEAFGNMGDPDNVADAMNTYGLGIASVLVSKGLESLSEEILARVAASEIADAVPVVGWILRLASMALDAVGLIESGVEIVSSPAVIEVDLKRQMSFNFTLHPDPLHGVAGQSGTAIWPAVADNYRILVNYKNGTSFEAKGDVPLLNGGPSNQAIQAGFTVPWGGSMQVIAAVYSKNGWLCGKYATDWMDAVPDDISHPENGKNSTGNITEILVPLTSDVQYNFKWKMIYDEANGHHWWGTKAGATIPTATQSSLNPGPGNNIASLTGITINESAFVIGYGWQGTGENVPLENGTSTDYGLMNVFQNLSVLEEPDKYLKFPSFGFKTQPGLVYDVYGGTKSTIGPLNFVMDTRDVKTGYLRQVVLDDNSPTFDLDSKLCYGKFTLGSEDGVFVDDMAVHPGGYVVAVNFKLHKMQILQLPEVAIADANAPFAATMSGQGILQGLMQGPIAISISPDGKILILESLNERVQTFDIKGNPAPSFKGKQLFTIANGASMLAELNQKTAPAELIASFINNGATHLFNLDGSLSSVLNAGVMTQSIIDAFSSNKLYLAYLTDSDGKTIKPDPKKTAFITVVTQGKQWNVVDPSRNYTYILSLENGVILVSDQLNNTQIIILTKDTSWQLKDLAGGKSYLLNINAENIDVFEYISYFNVNPNNEPLSYLDVAIESKGYIYVLAYNNDLVTGGNIPNNAYVLDVYTPLGEHLFRTPDAKLSGASNMQYIAAGKIALDIWRNLFSLNYEKLLGPGGRTEPSISQWTPTPPLFDLDLSDAATLDSANISNINSLFASKLVLSATAIFTVVHIGQHWKVSDQGKVYDILTTTEKIEVYDIPAS